MPLPTPPPSTPPIEASPIADLATLLSVRDELCALSAKAGLQGRTPEQRQRAGVTGTLGQMKQSFAILRFFQDNPRFRALFAAALPDQHRRATGVRLYAAQARQMMGRVRPALDAAVLLTEGRITDKNDRIEDACVAQWSDAGRSQGQRAVLESRFRDPLRLRELWAESADNRRARREQRKLLRRSARSEAQRLRVAPTETARLRDSAREPQGGK